ncbi:hypothetical protein FG03402.1 [Paecilomyces variotii No. 5]|uniref:Histidine phosphatase superfamily n=1 Tax=Byssochlamys spectabilis (strain No. 5 / NBRC 109023) TaxID=1356009 RepID=V5G3I9_BYSSN|nr:hypothetical protein FG03402.1 [Paecilomyces variotii No. 5]
MRCRISAMAFSNGILGKKGGPTRKQDDYLLPVDSKVKVLKCENGSHQCDNLRWHKAFSVNQSAGRHEFEKLMQVTTLPSYKRLYNDWHAQTPLLATDIYAMQLLHCYDVVANRPTPFDECFDADDWAGFEYLRDVKYYFSEGYGMPQPGFYAIPWLKAAMNALSNPHSRGSQLPLRIAFAHREEILYLCCLLAINFQKNWEPALNRVDEDRQWRAALLAPYLGHVGIESYSGSDGEKRVRVILNGDVKPAFWGIAHEDGDGGYDFDIGDLHALKLSLGLIQKGLFKTLNQNLCFWRKGLKFEDIIDLTILGNSINEERLRRVFRSVYMLTKHKPDQKLLLRVSQALLHFEFEYLTQDKNNGLDQGTLKNPGHHRAASLSIDDLLKLADPSQ